MSPTGKPGFTLVEMIVTAVIIAVLAAMAVPRLAGAWGGVAMRSSCQRLLVEARYAQRFAINRSTTCRLVIDKEENAFWIEAEPNPAEEPGVFQPLRADTRTRQTLAKGLEFKETLVYAFDDRGLADQNAQARNAPDQTVYINFRSDGRADAAAVQLTDRTVTRTLLIAPSTGRSIIADEAVDEPPIDREDLDL